MGESRKQLQTRLLKNILKFSMKEQEDLLETKKEGWFQSKMIKFSRKVVNGVKGGTEVQIPHNWSVFLS